MPPVIAQPAHESAPVVRGIMADPARVDTPTLDANGCLIQMDRTSALYPGRTLRTTIARDASGAEIAPGQSETLL